MFERLKKLIQRPADAGGKESAMAEQNPNATPPASSGGITQEQLNKAVETAVAAAIKPFAEAQVEIGKNHKILADTIAALPAVSGKKDEKKADEPKPLTAEDVSKIVSDSLKAAREADQQTASKSAARQRVVDAKLKDVPPEFLSALPDTDNEAELNAAADKIVTRVNDVLKVKQADVGGAGKDGGKKPGEGGAAPTPTTSGVSEGVAKLADSIQLPR
jgi:hypothetical protein